MMITGVIETSATCADIVFIDRDFHYITIWVLLSAAQLLKIFDHLRHVAFTTESRLLRGMHFKHKINCWKPGFENLFFLTIAVAQRNTNSRDTSYKFDIVHSYNLVALTLQSVFCTPLFAINKRYRTSKFTVMNFIYIGGNLLIITWYLQTFINPLVTSSRAPHSQATKSQLTTDGNEVSYAKHISKRREQALKLFFTLSFGLNHVHNIWLVAKSIFLQTAWNCPCWRFRNSVAALWTSATSFFLRTLLQPTQQNSLS